jgi:hypothetical protein
MTKKILNGTGTVSNRNRLERTENQKYEKSGTKNRPKFFGTVPVREFRIIPTIT